MLFIRCLLPQLRSVLHVFGAYTVCYALYCPVFSILFICGLCTHWSHMKCFCCAVCSVPVRSSHNIIIFLCTVCSFLLMVCAHTGNKLNALFVVCVPCLLELHMIQYYSYVLHCLQKNLVNVSCFPVVTADAHHSYVLYYRTFVHYSTFSPVAPAF